MLTRKIVKVGGNDIIRISVNYNRMTTQLVEECACVLFSLIDKYRSMRSNFAEVSLHLLDMSTVSEMLKYDLVDKPKLEGRNVIPGPFVADIDLRGTPIEDVDPKEVTLQFHLDEFLRKSSI